MADAHRNYTWEEAVNWLCDRPEQEFLVRACYFDDPLIDAAVRFAQSEEWQAVQSLIASTPGSALDLGAGRGISSYALAIDGWQVTAIEPDPSLKVGAGAIRDLAGEAGLPIEVVEKTSEALPFKDQSFDLVYARQALHHADDLPRFCLEAARVLKPGGQFIATREHVISRREDLELFLNAHPLHRLYGGENAYLLGEYVSAISEAGLRDLSALGPFDSVINYFPMTCEEWTSQCRQPLEKIIGPRLARILASEKQFLGRRLLAGLARARSRRNDTPGRLYSFIARKPLQH